MSERNEQAGTAGEVPAHRGRLKYLAAGILIDATLIRMILVPAFMQVAGDVNWWLPARIARIVRVQPFVDATRLEYVRLVDYGLGGVLPQAAPAPARGSRAGR
jgi:hypothetical protein